MNGVTVLLIVRRRKRGKTVSRESIHCPSPECKGSPESSIPVYGGGLTSVALFLRIFHLYALPPLSTWPSTALLPPSQRLRVPHALASPCHRARGSSLVLVSGHRVYEGTHLPEGHASSLRYYHQRFRRQSIIPT